MKSIFIISSVFVISSLSVSISFAYPIAGLTPYQRPISAPVIKAFQKSDVWYENALHGVEQPYPASFRFLEDQGGWYTPFNHRGMTGPYDIRNWHK